MDKQEALGLLEERWLMWHKVAMVFLPEGLRLPQMIEYAMLTHMGENGMEWASLEDDESPSKNRKMVMDTLNTILADMTSKAKFKFEELLEEE